jgi:hypothetical protein
MLAYDCPEWLWEYPVETALYLYNRSLSSSHTDKTPYELMFNKIPDVSAIVAFYCPRVCGVPPEFRSKWEELGYAKNYLVRYLRRTTKFYTDMIAFEKKIIILSVK